MTSISNIWKQLTPILSNLNNFHSLEVVGRVSETRLQVGKNSDWIIWRLKGYVASSFCQWWQTDRPIMSTYKSNHSSCESIPGVQMPLGDQFHQLTLIYYDHSAWRTSYHNEIIAISASNYRFQVQSPLFPLLINIRYFTTMVITYLIITL